MNGLFELHWWEQEVCHHCFLDSGKVIFNLNSPASSHWLNKCAIFSPFLQNLTPTYQKLSSVSLIATGAVFFVFINVHSALNACFLSPFDCIFLPTLLQSFVIHCFLASFILLAILLLRHLYLSSDELCWNCLGFCFTSLGCTSQVFHQWFQIASFSSFCQLPAMLNLKQHLWTCR